MQLATDLALALDAVAFARACALEPVTPGRRVSYTRQRGN